MLPSPFPALALGAALFAATAAAQDDRPNIVFVFSDDHAVQAISALGSRVNVTPNIDRLAREGITFRQSFCCNSICGPSRAAILTGLHSHANGFRQNGDRFDGDQQTFPKMLQAAGYATAMIGKWHLSSDPQGFDHWEVLPGQGQYYNPDLLSAKGRRRVEGYCTDVVTDLAIDWLDERVAEGDQPFLLMCQHKAPHRPWLPGPGELELYENVEFPIPETLFDDYEGRGPAAADHAMGIDAHMTFAYDLQIPHGDDERLRRAYDGALKRMTPAQRARWDAAFEAENQAFLDDPPVGAELVKWKYQRYMRNYLRCVAGVDKSLGRILRWLEDQGLEDDTLVVYSSDQGFYLGEHGWFDKRWMYEESMRMPLLARWPARIEPGTNTDALVQNIDYAPTFLELAGLAPKEPMHGRSLVPLFAGGIPSDWRHSLYYHYYESPSEHQVAAHRGVRTDRYKLIHFFEPNRSYWELYDLERDPQEVQSRYDDPELAEVQKQLKAELQRLAERFGAPEVGGG